HVADQEDDGVAEVLEVLHLAEEHGVAQVQVRRGGVEADFNAEFAAGLGGLNEGLAQVFFADNLRHAFAQVSELFVDGHWLSAVLRALLRSWENLRILSTSCALAGVSPPLEAR